MKKLSLAFVAIATLAVAGAASAEDGPMHREMHHHGMMHREMHRGMMHRHMDMGMHRGHHSMMHHMRKEGM